MAKFSGTIGYSLPVESSPGVWVNSIVEKKYRGDLIQDQRRMPSSEKVNDDIDIDNSISVVADAYAYENICSMAYVVLWNVPWKIKSFSIQRPRIVLMIGGIYNGERPPIAP